MTTKEIKKLVTTILTIVALIIAVERLYNSRSEFNVKAEDASHYGIVEAKIENRIKIKDFEYIYNVLEANYPYFEVNKRQNGIDWLENKNKYKRLIRNTKTDAEFYAAMEKILGDLNDENVNILSGEEFHKLYKSCYLKYSQSDTPEYMAWYDAFNNPFVMYRYEFNGDLENIKLYEDNNLETQILVKNSVAYMNIKEMASFDVLDEDYTKAKEFLKEIENYDKLIIDIRATSGNENTYWENIVGLLIDEPLSVEYFSFFKGGHRHKNDPYRVEGSMTIEDLDENILNQFPEEIKDSFSFYKKYPISIEPLENINFKGKVYLLVDKNVVSAAESFASFAKDTGFATLIGETTGGNKTYENVPVTFLTKSKFAIKYSREMAMNVDGSINMETKTVPNIKVDPTPSKDFKVDQCIQAAIKDGEK